MAGEDSLLPTLGQASTIAHVSLSLMDFVYKRCLAMQDSEGGEGEEEDGKVDCDEGGDSKEQA